MATETLNLIQSLGIILTAGIMIWQAILQIRQMRSQIRQNKATTSAILSSRSDEINRLIFQYPDVWRDLDNPYTHQTKDLRGPFIDIILNLFEQIYLQSEKFGGMEKGELEIWTRVMKDMFRKRYVTDYWKTVSSFYDTDYVRFIENVIL